MEKDEDQEDRENQYVKEPNWEKCSEDQVWKYVATHLSRNGIDTILVGGAVVAVYSEGLYQSGDLDMVITNYLVDNLPETMAKIGFQNTDLRHYRHPKCDHIFVEFCSPPVAIGDDTKIKAREVKVGQSTIKIFSPTDCVRDRLASYIHFQARECLDQAVLVALRQEISLPKVRSWCQSEGGERQYQEFAVALKLARSEST